MPNKPNLALLLALTPTQASVPLNRRDGDYAYANPGVELPMLKERPFPYTTSWYAKAPR